LERAEPEKSPSPHPHGFTHKECFAEVSGEAASYVRKQTGDLA